VICLVLVRAACCVRRAPRSSTCDAEQAAPKVMPWARRLFTCAAQRKLASAQRSSTCDTQLGNGLGTTIKYLRSTTKSAAPGQVNATQNKRRLGRCPGLGDYLPARRRGNRPWRNDQVPATHNEAMAWVPRSSTCEAQRENGLGAVPRETAWAPRPSTCAAPRALAWAP
jgi:hypothetical protein